MNLKEFYNLIKDICPTYHYESDSEEYPRQVYTEYAINYDYASNEVYEKKVSINLNYYSKDEFDISERKLELILMTSENITFNKEVDFDRETKVINTFYDIEITEVLSYERLVQELEMLLNENDKKNIDSE